MFFEDHQEQSAQLIKVIMTLHKDKKYFVVADSEGYLSIIGKKWGKYKP
jgi:hypothetical protein